VIRRAAVGSSLAAAVAAALLVGAARDARAAEPTKAQCVAANESAQTLRQRGQLGAARAQLLVCAAARCPGPVRDDCTQRLDEIQRVQPTIVFDAKDAGGRDLPAVKVTMDGRAFAERLDGTAVPADPGEHTFVFEAAGQLPVTARFVLHEGEKSRRELITIGQKAAEPPPPPPAPPPASPPPVVLKPAPPARETPESPPSGWSGRKTLALAAMGVGVAGLVVGSVFGMQAIGKNNDSNADGHCDPTGCDAQGKQLRNDALDAASTSTVAFGVGLAALAGGVVLWVTAPSPQHAAAQLMVGPGDLRIAGRW
jgi:hypothetical protein